MSTRLICTVIAVWLVIVAAAVGFGLFSGIRVSVGTTAIVLAVALMPPAILFKLFWGPEPQTVAQLLRGRP